MRRLLARALFERGGIETGGDVSAAALGLEDPRVGYAPSPWRGLRRSFRRVGVTRDDVFVDFGSGKGRVVLEAARHPFARVVGIEVSPRLHTIAVENLVRARHRLRCADVRLLCADAAEAPVPEDVTVAFFFNPFRRELFRTVAGRLAESVRRNPRTLRLVYVNPQEHDALLEAGAFHVEWIWGRGGPAPEDVAHSIGLYELGRRA